MATTYKLAYAAGFTSAQVVASQAWFDCLFFALATLAGHVLGHRWQRAGWKLALKLMGLGALTCLTSILYCYAMSVLPAPVALTLLFQFTWLGLVWQTVMTRRPPRPLQVVSALVIVFGTVFASGVYKTGITGYDPVALLCALGAAVSCSLFVTLSGRVEAPCSSEQRGVIVCADSVIMSLTVCPDYVVSGVLAQGILPFAVIAGFFGMLCPVLLFGMGSPHLPAGLSTVMAAAELPAGLLIAMIVLGEPLSVVEWLGVAIILAGVCLAPRGRARDGLPGNAGGALHALPRGETARRPRLEDRGGPAGGDGRGRAGGGALGAPLDADLGPGPRARPDGALHRGDRLQGLLLRPEEPPAEGHQREHQRAAQAALPEGRGLLPRWRRRGPRGPGPAQRAPEGDAGVEDAGGGAGGGIVGSRWCIDRLTPPAETLGLRSNCAHCCALRSSPSHRPTAPHPPLQLEPSVDGNEERDLV